MQCSGSKELAHDSILTQFSVEVQLKATKQVPIEQDGKYSYSLKVKNYNELRSTNTGAPAVTRGSFPARRRNGLVDAQRNCPCARRCAYWLSLAQPRKRTKDRDRLRTQGEPALGGSPAGLMTRFSKREVVDYVA